MSHHQGDDADYMADEYEMEDVDDDMDDEFRGRDIGGSDSDVDEYDYMVCHMLTSSSYLLKLILINVQCHFIFCRLLNVCFSELFSCSL